MNKSGNSRDLFVARGCLICVINLLILPLTPEGCKLEFTAQPKHPTQNPHLHCCILSFDLLKPTGYVIHQQFNIQQLNFLPTLYLCVLYLSENKQRLVPLTA